MSRISDLEDEIDRLENERYRAEEDLRWVDDYEQDADYERSRLEDEIDSIDNELRYLQSKKEYEEDYEEMCRSMEEEEEVLLELYSDFYGDEAEIMCYKDTFGNISAARNHAKSENEFFLNPFNSCTEKIDDFMIEYYKVKQNLVIIRVVDTSFYNHKIFSYNTDTRKFWSGKKINYKSKAKHDFNWFAEQLKDHDIEYDLLKSLIAEMHKDMKKWSISK